MVMEQGFHEQKMFVPGFQARRRRFGLFTRRQGRYDCDAEAGDGATSPRHALHIIRDIRP